MHPVVIMSYDKSPAINKAVEALEEAGLEVRVLNTNYAKLADFLGALAGEDDEEEHAGDDTPPSEETAEDTQPSDDESDTVDEDPGITSESLKLIVDGEELDTVIVEGKSELIPNGRMIGGKTAYMINESHYAFWPAMEDGLYDMTHNVQVQMGDWATYTDVTIAEAAEKPLLKLNLDTYIRLCESSSVTVDKSMADVVDDAADVMSEIVDDYKKHEGGQDSVPAAPDTSKFKAIKYGMIDHIAGLTVPGGYYGFTRRYEHFLKLGTTVDASVRKEMMTKFFNHLSDDIGATIKQGDWATIKCNDGVVYIGTVSGTAWGGVGVYREAKK